jgi:hypothetical protein
MKDSYQSGEKQPEIPARVREGAVATDIQALPRCTGVHRGKAVDQDAMSLRDLSG